MKCLALFLILCWIGLGQAVEDDTVTNTSSLEDEVSNYQCNYADDLCPIHVTREFVSQFNRYCDNSGQLWENYEISGWNSKCLDGDCWDCDPCGVMDFTSCSQCLAVTGCHWCPGDARCRSQALGEDYWKGRERHAISSCSSKEEWKTLSNDSSDISSVCGSSNNNVYNDPLYDAMAWSYDLTNIEAVWRQNITGTGVHVRINDSGMDGTHPEISRNFDWNSSCPEFVQQFGPDTNASQQEWHGTSVASILAGAANNGLCAVGIAPGVRLSSCAHGLEGGEWEEVTAVLLAPEEGVDISQNSWGTRACYHVDLRRKLRQLKEKKRRRLQEQTDAATGTTTCLFDHTNDESPCEACASFFEAPESTNSLTETCKEHINDYCKKYFRYDQEVCTEFLDVFVACEYHASSLPEATEEALRMGVMEGRGGKGIIYVFSGGNDNVRGEVINMDGFVNSRYTISVGAVGKGGKHAHYSTTGSALFLSAPGGDLQYVSNLVVAGAAGGCKDGMGTSFSAPAVSGVVALLLEVNQELGYRDVQGILANTSQQSDPSDSSWTVNSGGYHHSYKYGFGIVNAAAAVEAAQEWINWGPEEAILLESGVINLNIPNSANDPASSSQVVKDANEFFAIESVVVNLDLLHESRGDLLISLTSPSGTESILHRGRRPENRQLQIDSNETWKLMTLRHWGEHPAGTWTLQLLDEQEGPRPGCANLPFKYVGEENEYGFRSSLSCFEAVYVCANQFAKDPAILDWVDTRNNRNIEDACCDCGGGASVSKDNILRSWNISIFGHFTGIAPENEDSHSTESETPLSSGNPTTMSKNSSLLLLMMILLAFGSLH